MIKKDSILEVNEDALLMQFLLSRLKGKNRDNIKSLLKNKQVVINNHPVSQFNHPLHKGDILTVKGMRADDMPSENYLKIVFEDEHIIVIDKMPGLLSVSDGNNHVTAFGILTEWVQKQDPKNKVYIVHRLDQYTSGLLMFVKSEAIQNIFRNEWKQYITERTYTAIVEGDVKKSQGRISSYLLENNALVMISSQDPAKGKMAITHYKKIKSNERYSMLEVNLETGKKNQIRVHMQDIGHSIAGDRKYGARTNPIRRLCLHATVLALNHPVTGKIIRFESPIPQEFLRLF